MAKPITMITEQAKVIETFITLAGINGPSKKEKKINRFLRHYFRGLTSSCIEDSAGKKIQGESGNLIFKIKGNVPDAPPLSFWAHMDTVAETGGLKIVQTKDIIKTDGSTILGGDDRAGIAALCEAGRILKEKKLPHPDIELVFTVAEEVGLLGAKHCDYHLLKSKTAYVLDCNGPLGTVITQAPSAKKISVQIKGRAAHAGIEPEKGRSAIIMASEAIAHMKLGRVNKQTTANIGIISGGEAINIIPEQVCLKGEARSFSKEELARQISHMKNCFKKAVLRHKGTVSFHIVSDYTTFSLRPTAPVLTLAKQAIYNLKLPYRTISSGGGSDANILNEHHLQALNLGIGMQNAHTKKESIRKSDLEKTVQLVLEIITTATHKEVTK